VLPEDAHLSGERTMVKYFHPIVTIDIRYLDDYYLVVTSEDKQLVALVSGQTTRASSIRIAGNLLLKTKIECEQIHTAFMHGKSKAGIDPM
jgi:hypothetical protein